MCMRWSGCCLGIVIAAAPLAAQTPAPMQRQVQVGAITWIIDLVVLKLSQVPAVVCLSSAIPRQLDGHTAPMLPGVDLDSATISRIPTLRIPLRPGNACSIGTVRPRPTLETSTGRQAVAVQVGPAQMEGEARAAVEIEYRMHGLWASGYRCAATRRGVLWLIDACTRTWVS